MSDDMYDEVRRLGRRPAPEDQVPDDERMTPAEVRAVREYLGLTLAEAADRLGVAESTVRHWEAGRYAVPDGVRCELESWEDQAAATVGALVEVLLDEPGEPVLAIPARGERGGWPARWWRHVAMRVAVEVPGLSIRYGNTSDTTS